MHVVVEPAARRRSETASRPVEGAEGARTGRVLGLACGAVGIGMTLIVGLDGWWPWRVLRVVVLWFVVAQALAIMRRRSRGAAATVAVAIGLVAVAVGAPIGSSYLTTTGVSLRAIGGVVTLVGGLVLLIVGGIGAFRSVHGWWRLCAIPLALVVGYGAGFPLVAAVYATNVPRPALGRATPADRGLAYENATFVTSDGVTLSGWYLPSRNRSAVVLLHGASSTRSNVLDQAVVLARDGYGVLLFDARGHGRSGGRAMDFGWYGDRDVAAGVTYLEHRRDVDPERIGAIGMSMGGEEAVGAMATDPRIRAVVAEGATNRVAGDWGWLPERYGVRGRFQQGVFWLTYRIADVLTDASPPITLRDAVTAAAPRPILLIAAGNVGDEAHADNAIQAASPRSVQVWVVAGADHTGGLRTQPVEWERRVRSFFDEALLGGGPVPSR